MLKKQALILVLFVLAGFMPEVGPPGHPLADAAAAQDSGAASPRVERLEHDFEQALARVQPLFHRYGYLAVFAAIGVEGMGIPAPGQTLLIAAALGAAHGNLSLAWVLISAFLAAALGNTLGYLLGRWGGRPLLARLKVRGDRLARLEEKFRRYGVGLLLVARFFDGLRQVNGIMAGMLAMDWKIFMALNVLGAMLWTGAWGLGTYFLDRKISPIHRALAHIEPFVAALTLVGVLALLVYLFRRRRTQKPQEKS